MHRVVSTTRRLIVTLLVVWATAAALLAVRPLDPGPTALAITDWPLWFSVPVVVLGWLILVASWSVALCLPIVGYALLVHGRPWRDTPTDPRSAPRHLPAQRQAVFSALVDDTLLRTRPNSAQGRV